jgi:hypothetical protein
MKKLGDCRDKLLIQKIFGSIQKFFDEVEENGNNFVFFNGKQCISVEYDENTDIHTFFV